MRGMCKRLGEAGSGQLTKMVNQESASRGLVQGLSEGIHFAKKSGLDVAAVIDTISEGRRASRGRCEKPLHKTMNDDKYDFRLSRSNGCAKDLSICLAESRSQTAADPFPVTASRGPVSMRKSKKMGGKRWDTSSLLARLQR